MGSGHEGRNIKVFEQNLHSLRLARAIGIKRKEVSRIKGSIAALIVSIDMQNGQLIPLSLKLVKKTIL